MSLMRDQRSFAASCHGHFCPALLCLHPPPPLSCPPLQRINALPALPPSKRNTEGNNFHTRVPSTSPRISLSHSALADARVLRCLAQHGRLVTEALHTKLRANSNSRLFCLRMPSSPPWPLRPLPPAIRFSGAQVGHCRSRAR